MAGLWQLPIVPTGFYITYIDDSTAASFWNRICVQHVTNTGSRVVEQDLDGKKAFSKVVVLQSGTKSSLVIYPNPAKDKLYIDGLTNYTALKITDAGGRIMLQQNISTRLKHIDTRLLNAGVYLLTVSSDTETQTIKFIKQ